jgi:hypothetical protein
MVLGLTHRFDVCAVQATGVKHWIVVPVHQLTDALLMHPLRAQTDDTWCPSLRDVAGAEHAYCVTQRPGDLVYVPPFWWHATRNGHRVLTIGMGAQRRSRRGTDKKRLTAQLASNGPASEVELLGCSGFRTMRALVQTSATDALTDAYAGWSMGLPRWLTSSWQLIASLKRRAEAATAEVFAATFRVGAERVRSVAGDASLDLSSRERAALYAFYADLVGVGIPDSLRSTDVFEAALSLYDTAFDLYPDLSAASWHRSGYTELMLLQQREVPQAQEQASMKRIQARLWHALELNATFEESLFALRSLGLERPRRKRAPAESERAGRRARSGS